MQATRFGEIRGEKRPSKPLKGRLDVRELGFQKGSSMAQEQIESKLKKKKEIK